MPRMIYITQGRFPTEKAHGLQIAQNCEAFAHTGYDVELWVSNRRNVAAMQQVTDIHAHYGVDKNFTLRRLWSIGTYQWTGGKALLERIAFYINLLTFIMAVWWRLRATSYDVVYCREQNLLLLLSFFVPQEKLAFEIHLFNRPKGTATQRRALQRVAHVIAITPQLAQDMVASGLVSRDKVLVAHDGFREARFRQLPSPQAARTQAGWPQDLFVIGFVGRLQMLNMDKGIGTLIEAIATTGRRDIALALVGGPEGMVEQYRQLWRQHGLAEAYFLTTGQVASNDVPLYLRAFDVCAMPHPYTEQYAYYTSPLKLFEYMASGGAIIASDLPGWSDVVQDDEQALLVAPGDVEQLARAIIRLQDNPALRERIGQAAQNRAFAQYTWGQRAQAIRQHLTRNA